MEVRFGNFFVDSGFREIHYEYSEKFFGNEVFDLQSGDIVLRFIRDRGSLLTLLRKGPGEQGSLDILLARLRVPEPRDESRLVSEWPRLVKLLG
jgi:hypothetical protein